MKHVLAMAALATACVLGDLAPAKAAEPSARPAGLRKDFVDARSAPANIRAPIVTDPENFPGFALFRDCETCPDMVVLPGSTFLMGSPPGEIGRGADEEQVSVSAPAFAISRFPITRSEYARFVDSSGRSAGNGCWSDRETLGVVQMDPKSSWRDPGFPQDDRHPAVCVNWSDAASYAWWLAQQTGRAYRLASEAEYEYANRGGRTTPYFWGSDPNAGCKFVNAADDTVKRVFPNWSTMTCNDGYERTSPVGTYRPNPFGLFDMTGNVRSWTADCYVNSYASNPKNGQANTSGDCRSRVLRGGAWDSFPLGLRAALRDWYSPTQRSGRFGFRIARSLPPR
jgi:sulfatase modifying factor 1